MSDDFEWHPRGTADKLARYEEALRPFADASVDLAIVPQVKASETWLWRPQSNFSAVNGINCQHILDAREALKE